MQATILTTFYNHYELLWAWTLRTIRARYKQSILGGLWAVLQPLATVIVFSIIFTRFVPIDTKGVPYVLFSFVAMVPWTFFSGSVTDMVESLVSNMNLVGKIYFPREILPMSALLARLLDYGIASLLIVILLIVYRIPFFAQGWLFLPVILITQIALSLGLGFIGAAINVFYRDMRHLFVLGLQIWLYASPIIYPVSDVPERFQTLYFLNPMAGVIQSYRDILLYQTIPGFYLWLAAAISLLVFLGGYWFFKRVEFQFADLV